MISILLLEDDLSLIDGLSYSLKKENYEVTTARTVGEALDYLRQRDFDLLLLDLTLPDGSGFEVCRAARARSTVPIIFLTAADEEVNQVMGLDLGADDYITKPFQLGVLMSRIKALLRRSREYSQSTQTLTTAGLSLDPLTHQVAKDGTALTLTASEFKLLSLLMANPGQVLTKELILEKLWDNDAHFVDDNTLAVYVRRLRLKIEDDPAHPRLLTTVRGLGYRWQAEGEQSDEA